MTTQAPFDSSTPTGGSSSTSDAGETGAARGQANQANQGTSARRRPTRRSRAASAKPATPAAAEPTTQPAAQPTTSAPEATATPAASAASADEATTTPAGPAARGERRPSPNSSRSRGAKRPATRGKSAPQLIIARAEVGEADADTPAEAPVGPAATVTESAEAIAEMPAAEAQSAEPVVVPVVAPVASAEAAAPAEPRKLRFGLPRRFRQPDAIIAETTAPADQPAAQVAAPAESAAEASGAEPLAEPAPTAPATPRYRFDSARRSALPSVTRARPERLSSQQPGLYTEAPATTATAPSAPEGASHTATPPAPLFELPSLDELVGAPSAESELPSFSAFEQPTGAATSLADTPDATDTPDAAEVTEASEASEASEAGEGEGEGASAGRRRRRRRHSSATRNGAHAADADEALDDETPAVVEAAPFDETLYADETPAYEEPPAPTRARNGRYGYSTRTPRRAATPALPPALPAEPAWDDTAQQAEISPYASPEPAYARGFGPTPSGVATPARETYPRPSRIERGDATAAGLTQLGVVMREAINTQTDRLLNELRRQQPPAVTVSIPNALSSERVGIFVDVANVVYSARNLRAAIDFGRLLDFLRANRRLARAQAYAPTNPDQGAEQTFLTAVKGLGYRITTKNYKTFASGAKKADLDLDLCMDIVRIVEARAVDTIVLVSGDSDFLPLLDYCSDHGVRVEVAAFDDAASMILRQSCDLFVNLSLVDGIRG